MEMSIVNTPLGKVTDVLDVGSGTYGKVIKCRYVIPLQNKPDVVAIKSAESRTETEGIEHTSLIEVAVAKLANHPNIVKVYDVKTGVANKLSTLWFDMDYYVIDLGKYMENENYNVRSSVISQCMNQIGSALHYLHCLGIVHRDIKHNNILLKLGEDKRYTYHLADFGMAHPVGPNLSTDLPSNNKINGEYQVYNDRYRAPEISSNHPYGVKADVWAFGATLLMFLCGEYIETEEIMENIGNITKIVTSYTDPDLSDKKTGHVINCISKMLTILQNQRPHIHVILPDIQKIVHLSEPLALDLHLSHEVSKLCKFLSFSGRTTEVAINIITKYINVDGKPKNTRELIITCAWMAHKMIDIKYVKLRDILSKLGGKISPTGILIMENKIVLALNGNLL